MDAEEASAIGARARKIRRRRGLSLDVVAGIDPDGLDLYRFVGWCWIEAG